MLSLNQLRHTFNPELDVAGQFGRKILRTKLAIAQIFPLFRVRVGHAVSPHYPPEFHRLACAHLPLFSFPKGQVLPTNDPPKPPRLFRHLRHFRLGDVTISGIHECAFQRLEPFNSCPDPAVLCRRPDFGSEGASIFPEYGAAT
jgi:hypothetical protein